MLEVSYHRPFVLQIVLRAFGMPGSVQDTAMLPIMLEEIKHRGFKFQNRFFDADHRYDSDINCKAIFMQEMIPNIKQRKGATNRSKHNRKKAARLFNKNGYNPRAMIEGIFGAEETRRHWLYSRFIGEDNRKRFAK